MQSCLLIRVCAGAVALAGAFIALPAGYAPADTSCPLPANRPTAAGPKTGRAIMAAEREARRLGKITLKPEAADGTINFGGTRGTKATDVVLLASKPLPRGFSGAQLELDSPRRFARTGQNLDSASLRLPRFSNPQILEHRKKIRLRVCVDATDAPAGAYSGQIFISGPPRIASTSVALTVNVKTEERTFWLFLILALLGAFLLLLFKAAKEVREKDEAEKRDTRKQVVRWKVALRSRLKDPTFVVSTIVALGAAFVAMRGIYDSTPAWGTETWTNVFALVGTAFGAAGVGSLISTFMPKRES